MKGRHRLVSRGRAIVHADPIVESGEEAVKAIGLAGSGGNSSAEEEMPTVLVNFVNCFNRNPCCEHWAVLGECERNPNFMRLFCKLEKSIIIKNVLLFN